MDWGPPGGGRGGNDTPSFPDVPSVSSSISSATSFLLLEAMHRLVNLRTHSCVFFWVSLGLLLFWVWPPSPLHTGAKKKKTVVPPRLRVCVCELVCVCSRSSLGLLGLFFLLKARDMLSKHGRMGFISSSLGTLWSTIKDVQCYFPRPSPPLASPCKWSK